ncbi:MAG: T9SS type A sorting domain-containing protein [Bacteroidota bacterium]
MKIKKYKLKSVYCIRLLITMVILHPYVHCLQAQVSSGGIPYSAIDNIYCPDSIRNATIPEFVLPYMDNDSLISAESRNGNTYKYGVGLDVNINLNNSGRWDLLPDSSRLWRLQITSTFAYGLQLNFNNFVMPDNGELFIYTPDRSFILGAFTLDNNKESGAFAIQPLPGNSIILEYYEAFDALQVGIMEISRVGHVYKDIFNVSASKASKVSSNSGYCQINVNCEVCAKDENVIRSVVYIFDPITYNICTGAMINNTSQDGKQYLLTAFHNLDIDLNCQLTNDEVQVLSQWIFIFNYEASDCSGSTGPQNQSVSGAVLEASSSISDYALLRLDEIIPPNYDVYLAGWDASGLSVTSAYAIHHPNGDIKKINCSTNIIPDDWGGCGTDGHWNIIWNNGVNEPGSSGSPLFDIYGRIIGQLTGGFSECEDIPSTPITEGPYEADFYGRLDVSWNNGLRWILDPMFGSSWSQDGIDLNDTPVFGGGGDPGGGGSGTVCCTVNPKNKTYRNRTWSDKFKIERVEISITGENIVIKNDSYVNFTAGSYIELTNFDVDESSAFYAQIAPCDGTGDCGPAGKKGNNENYGGNNVTSSIKEIKNLNNQESLDNSIDITNNITIHPNPTPGKFIITIPQAQEGSASIYITDILGRTVYEKQNNTEPILTVDLSTQRQGIFFVKVISGDEVFIEKIVLQ